MRIVVCDTGPVLHLREAGVLDVLRHAGEVLIPAAVDDELTRLVDVGRERSCGRCTNTRVSVPQRLQ